MRESFASDPDWTAVRTKYTADVIACRATLNPQEASE
jgi:hypothetical protein